MVRTAVADGDADALLERVRQLDPRDLMRLATLWAGIVEGSIDASRQLRRAAARTAIRVLTRGGGDDDATDSQLAAEAVQFVLASTTPRARAALRGPAADATFAIGDALDALRHRDLLTSIAYEELMRPWRELNLELEATSRGGYAGPL